MAGGQVLTSGQGTVTASGGTIQLVGTAVTVGQGYIDPIIHGQLFNTGQGSVVQSITIVSGPGLPFNGLSLTPGQGTITPQSGGLTLASYKPGIANTYIASASGTLTALGNDVTVNITGYEATFFQGNVSSGGQSLTGSAITSAQGAFTLSNVPTATLTGLESVIGQGAISAGQEADDTFIQSAYGNQLASADVPLVGSAVTSAQGDVGVTGDVTLPLVGEASTSAAGSVAFSYSFPITGSEIISAQQSMGAPGFTALTGAESTVIAGNVFTDNDRSYQLTGIASTVGQGLAVTSYLGFATGQVITVSQQGIGPRKVTLTGQQITVEQGRVTAPSALKEAGGPGEEGRRKLKLKKKDEQKVVVRIDGEDFIVESQEAAMALLEQAKEQAVLTAAQQAAEIVRKRLAKGARDGHLNTSPLRLDDPTITASGSPMAAMIERMFSAEISQVYARAKMDAEQLLLDKQREMLDEEESIVTLLMSE